MNKEKIKNIIEKCLMESPCKLDVCYDEPMSAHTTFRVGGPADCWVQPKQRKDEFPAFCVSLLNHARSAGVPVFILGGGANIVVSDKGIRGITLDAGGWKGQTLKDNELIIYSGTTMDEAAEYAANAGLGGLEFLAGMPGTTGGAVWMNARCYGRETADALTWTEIICYERLSANNGQLAMNNEYGIEVKEKKEDNVYIIKKVVTGNGSGFGYKLSPFQSMDCFILRACFSLKPGDKDAIYKKMEMNRKDRKEKGHYLFPCAGSVFKNNRDFGKPAGVIIDELGLRGLRFGGAQVAPFHGNIIINAGNATASDIRALADKVAAIVKEKAGFILEPEILFFGE